MAEKQQAQNSQFRSRALEINLERYRVEVEIDEQYTPLESVMSAYFGLKDGFHVFLKELSHPYRNWEFIIHEARGYALDYFHLFRDHPQGADAIGLYIDIFFKAIDESSRPRVRTEAVDNLLLYLMKVIKESGSHLEACRPKLDEAFRRMCTYDSKTFFSDPDQLLPHQAPGQSPQCPARVRASRCDSRKSAFDQILSGDVWLLAGAKRPADMVFRGNLTHGRQGHFPGSIRQYLA